MKKLISLLLVLCLAFSLCACGGSSDDKKPTESAPAASKPAASRPAATRPAATRPAPDDTAERVRGDYDLIAPFLALWTNNDMDGFYQIYDNWTWELLDAQGSYVESGECSYLDGYGLILEKEDGTDLDYLYQAEDGHVYNSASIQMNLAELPGPEGDIMGDYDLIAPYLALWTNEVIAGNYYQINDDWTWDLLDAEGTCLGSGKCYYEDGYGLVLARDGGDSELDHLYLAEDGHVYNYASIQMELAELPGPEGDITGG